MVRGAADAMEESGLFAVEMIIDLEMPEPFASVESTIHGKVDLLEGRSTFEGRPSDDDAWTELVVDGVAFTHARLSAHSERPRGARSMGGPV